LTTSNRTAAIGANRAVVTAHEKSAARGKNILKCVSTVSAEFKHATVETEVRIRVRCFKIEIVPECQSRRKYLEENQT
jgi:hypothetical protein